MDGDRPLTDLGLVVTGLPLARLVGVASSELAGEHDVTIGPPRRRAPSVSLTCRNSMNMVLVSSMGTIQRLIIGPLKGCSWWPFSQTGATCWRFGKTFSTIRAQILSPTRRVAI